MKVITVISQKGGAGKTTLAIHLAAAGMGAGLTALILDTDPQATARHWSEWRGSSALEVVDCASPSLLPRKPQQEIGRAHVCTPVTNAHLVCRLLLGKKKDHSQQSRTH